MIRRIKNLDGGSGPLIVMAPVAIGNEDDLSPRAISYFSKADLICCEDTRTTNQMLLKHGIHAKKLVSLYSQVEGVKAKEIVKGLIGTDTLLVYCSDAGTPGISDPGALLVKEAIDNNIRVTALPGPCALITALVISGLDTADFAFYGFLSDRSGARRTMLQEVSRVEIPMIFYESPVRVIETLKDMYEILGDRKFALLRELTKVNEEAIRGTLADYQTIDPQSIRGECVICVDGYKPDVSGNLERIKDLFKIHTRNGISASVSAKVIAEELGLRKNEVYRIVQKLSEER